ncbi:MAG: hypothetical protein HFJ20_05650 [Clostridia bacterium]|nr:hypothetical protein [Clostridia bacterium]
MKTEHNNQPIIVDEIYAIYNNVKELLAKNAYVIFYEDNDITGVILVSVEFWKKFTKVNPCFTDNDIVYCLQRQLVPFQKSWIGTIGTFEYSC